MKTSTRLILTLTVLVALITAIGSYFRLQQREVVLRQAMRNEMRAQSLTLQLALENIFRNGRVQEAQYLVDQLSQSPKVYGVLVFDDAGKVLLRAGSLVASDEQGLIDPIRVAATGEPREITRRFQTREVFSMISALTLDAGKRGAFELAQPTDFIKAEVVRARMDVALVSLPLFLAIVLAVLVVMRLSLVKPIDALLRGAAALGRGDLSYRVSEPWYGNEFTQLAREFNRMADNLAEQRKTAERELERRIQLERELRDTERLATVGRMAAGVAHEIGTPLNVIDARAEQLLERIEAPLPTRQRNLTIIRTQAERISRIVRQLLNLARPYQLNRQAVEAHRLIAGVLELLEATALTQQVELVVKEAEPVCFEVDGELIHQVLLNVCQNGLQAMPQGGQLLIEYPGTLLLKNDARFASFSIRDTGTGIAPENLAHIFDPFFTTKDVGNGTGLGLAVSRRIVEEHDGWISVANMAGGGARFTIFLPMAETQHQEASNTHEQSTVTNS